MALGQSANRGGVYILKGPEAEDHTLYASHTVWENRAVFEVRKTVGRSKAARKGDSGAASKNPADVRFWGQSRSSVEALPFPSLTDRRHVGDMR